MGKNKEHKVLLLLGGNLGNIAETFEKALAEIQTFCKVAQISSLYETEAWGMQNAPPFLNQAVVVFTRLSPEELLANLQEIERKYGRSQIKDAGYQSRPLDVDILFFGDEIVQKENLKIPHPRLHLRNFVLTPAAEIEPLWKHPLLKKTLQELLEKTEDQLEVRNLPKN